MIRKVAYAVLMMLAACAGKPIERRPPPSKIDPPITVVALPTPIVDDDRIVIEVKGTASRSDADPRTLRRIVAARRGAVELADGYTQVRFQVGAVLKGDLDDPNYAQRPTGANRLTVVLVDEAAHAAPPSMEGFEGTWRLTRLADGTLVASSIDDTPWPKEKIAGRRALIARARKQLRSPLTEDRIDGLDAIFNHRILELVPDIIPLLEDTSAVTGENLRRVQVGHTAIRMLHKMVGPLRDHAVPHGNTRDEWDTYWREATTRVPSLPTIVPTTVTELVRVPMNQSWPNIVAVGPESVVGMTRLDPPINGHKDGIAIAAAGQLTWIWNQPSEAVDAARGPAGLGVLFADSKSWRLVVPPNQPVKLAHHDGATHAALAAFNNGFVVMSIRGTRNVAIQAFDATGKPKPGKTITMPLAPTSQYHRGIYPVAIVRKPKGFIAAMEMLDGIYVATLDDFALGLGRVEKLIHAQDTRQPKVGVGTASALVVWQHHSHTSIATRLIDFDAHPRTDVAIVGSDVAFVAKPIALDDGFALAWIEGERDVHVGRFDAKGALVRDVVIDTRAADLALSLTRDGDSLVIAYEDEVEYPYPIVARRLQISALR